MILMTQAYWWHSMRINMESISGGLLCASAQYVSKIELEKQVDVLIAQ